MPQIKAAKRAPAIEKLRRVEGLIEDAEAVIASITPQELEEIGFTEARGTGAAINAVYRVIGHASSLRIIREHLRTELRQ